MVAFTSVLLAAAAAVGVTAAPASGPPSIEEMRAMYSLHKRGGTPSATGTHDGFYFSWWTDNQAQATYTNGPKGNYAVTWSGNGNLVGGKGFNPGSARTITYNAAYRPNGNSYLAVYGWTRNPLVEYYVVENFGTYDPSSNAQRKGNINVDGSNYIVAQSTRVNQPSIEGTRTFQQYWSVRSQKRSSGTVNMKAHFDAWAAQNMRLGSHDYQIVATEGYFSSGSSNVTVS